MRLYPALPLPDPGEPDARSAGRFMLWLLRLQWRTLVIGGFFGTLWMACIGALPGAIGQGIDLGITAKDTSATIVWAAVVVALAVVMALAGMVRHRTAVYNYLTGAFRIVQLTTRHATRVGAALPQRIATGEVVSVGSADPQSMGGMLDVLGRTIGSVITFAAVAVVLLTISPSLGAVILIGLPVQALIIGPLLKPLQRREHDYREQQGMLTSRANDIVAGLRVLRGIGGEELFARRYVEQSQQVRRFGVRVAVSSAVMKGLQMLLPGGLLAAVTWIGAQQAASGAISTGELVSVFGYTSFLLMPMSTFLETARKYTSAHAASQRIVKMLAVEPAVADTGTKTAGDIAWLEDPQSGLRMDVGSLTALACADPSEAAAIGDRLGRYVDSPAEADGVPLRELALSEVRQRILVTDNDARFFAGRLRDQLDVRGDAKDADIAEVIEVAVAGDAVDSVGGLDGTLEAEGRNVSGGQRQRLRLARALLVDPPILIMIEPTSAVDAHTEALIAQRLRKARNGKGTLVATTSPLMLEHADTVAFVASGTVQATGTHRQLMDSEPRYRALVSRESVETGKVAAQ